MPAESHRDREQRLARIQRMNPLAKHPETELFLIEQGEAMMAPATRDARDIEASAARKKELREQVKAAEVVEQAKKDEVSNAEKFGNWMAVSGMSLDTTGSDDLVASLNEVAVAQRDPRFDELAEADAAGAALLQEMFEQGLSPEERTMRQQGREEHASHARLVERDFRKQAREAAQALEDEKFLSMSRRQQEKYLSEQYRRRGFGRPVPDDAA